jgi:ankyrin repeat protein
MPPVLSPIMDALYHGRSDEAQRLLAEAGEGSLTIHEAASMGSLARLERLLADDPSAANAWSDDGFQPLGLACFFGRRAATELLLARGGEVNTHARHQFHVAALHAALAGPDPGIAHLLVAAGADVNARQQAGIAPLHETAQNGDLERTRLLLDHGAFGSRPKGSRRPGPHSGRHCTQARPHRRRRPPRRAPRAQACLSVPFYGLSPLTMNPVSEP